jgi:O-6-methylguanine DNA methyltransferase
MTTTGAVVSGVARVCQRTALGGLLIVAGERGVRAVTPLAAGRAGEEPVDERPGVVGGPALDHARAAAAFLRRYAGGERARYGGPLDVTAFALHHAVWERLRAIPFGATTTYGAIATAVGMPGEARAIGAAIGANPACILVPCHRVLGADGSLRGFAWGLDLKRRLLAHEGSGALSLFTEAGSPPGLPA